MSETGQGDQDTLTGLYESAIETAKKWDKAYFCYARYLDKLCQARSHMAIVAVACVSRLASLSTSCTPPSPSCYLVTFQAHKLSPQECCAGVA
jgi:hypothetical protein